MNQTFNAKIVLINFPADHSGFTSESMIAEVLADPDRYDVQFIYGNTFTTDPTIIITYKP